MQPFAFAAGLVLTITLLAGCTAPNPSAVAAGASVAGPSGSGPSAAGAWSVPVPVDSNATPTSTDAAASATEAGDVRAIPITGYYTDYPTGAGASCHGATDCGAVIPFGIHFTGTLSGEAQGIAHGGADSFDPAAPTRLSFTKDPVTFTGTIDGCGSGSLGMHIEGYVTADTASAVNETGAFIPGSASTGLAGVVDMFWAFVDGSSYPQPVAIAGTVWCR